MAVVKNDASYVRTEFAKLAVAMDRALTRIEATTADANASSAGRELLRRAGRAEERLKDVEDDVASLKTFRTEVKTATRVLYLLATVSSGSAILALLAVAAHVADPHLP